MNLLVYIGLVLTPVAMLVAGIWMAAKRKPVDLALSLTTLAICTASALALWFMLNAYHVFGVPSTFHMQYRFASAFLCPLGLPILALPPALWFILRNRPDCSASTILIVCSIVCIVDLALFTVGNIIILNVGWPHAFFEHVPRN